MSGISVVRGSSEPVDSASKWYLLCRADAFTEAAGNRQTRAVIVSVPAGVAEQASWKRKQREQLRSYVLYGWVTGTFFGRALHIVDWKRPPGKP